MGEGAEKASQKAAYSGGTLLLPPIRQGGGKGNSSRASHSGRGFFRGLLLFLPARPIPNPSLRTSWVNLARNSGSSLFCSRWSDRGLGASGLCQ